MSKRVVVYMSPWCYTSKDTQSTLNEWGVPATFINIKEDHAAAAHVRGWVGFESVPTIVIAEGEGVEPSRPRRRWWPAAVRRGVDRGSMMTEASRNQLRAWLVRHEFLAE